MFDKNLDMLYSLCYSQMIRLKISPTYIEHKILDETVLSTKTYILQYVEELKKKIDDDKKKYIASYLTWDVEFYNKDAIEKEQLLNNFQEKIKHIKSSDFLGINLSIIDTSIDNLYPNILPNSEVRETLWKSWLNIKENK